MVKDIHYYYDPKKKEFHSIVHLGKCEIICSLCKTADSGSVAERCAVTRTPSMVVSLRRSWMRPLAD